MARGDRAGDNPKSSSMSDVDDDNEAMLSFVGAGEGCGLRPARCMKLAPRLFRLALHKAGRTGEVSLDVSMADSVVRKHSMDAAVGVAANAPPSAASAAWLATAPGVGLMLG